MSFGFCRIVKARLKTNTKKNYFLYCLQLNYPIKIGMNSLDRGYSI